MIRELDTRKDDDNIIITKMSVKLRRLMLFNFHLIKYELVFPPQI